MTFSAILINAILKCDRFELKCNPLIVACNMNVHKRCQKNVANNCGINTKEMAQILQTIGISTDKLGTSRKPNKVSFLAIFISV